MMDQKTLTTNIIGGVVLAIIVAGFTWLITRVDEGGDAIANAAIQAQINVALEAAMKTPEGESYGAVLSRVDRKVAVIESSVDRLNITVEILLED
jgi:hypothetical protein